MFNIFGKKSKLKALNKKYHRLMSEAHQLSTRNRKASDAKIAEANSLIIEMQKFERV